MAVTTVRLIKIGTAVPVIPETAADAQKTEDNTKTSLRFDSNVNVTIDFRRWKIKMGLERRVRQTKLIFVEGVRNKIPYPYRWIIFLDTP